MTVSAYWVKNPPHLKEVTAPPPTPPVLPPRLSQHVPLKHRPTGSDTSSSFLEKTPSEGVRGDGV